MPPRTIFEKEQVLNIAYNIVEKERFKGLNARKIAKELNASVHPIFKHFKDMEELKRAVYEKIYSFEHNSELLQFKLEYRNVPMWPLIRTSVIQKAIDKENGINVNQRISVKRNKLVELTIRNPFLSLSKDVLYLGFEDRGMSSHEDGLVYDERIMPYMQLNRKSCMLISHPNLDVKYAYNNWKSDYAIHQFALKGL